MPIGAVLRIIPLWCFPFCYYLIRRDGGNPINTILCNFWKLCSEFWGEQAKELAFSAFTKGAASCVVAEGKSKDNGLVCSVENANPYYDFE